MTAYLGPETLSMLSVADRDIVHTALIEAARRDALTPVDLLKNKRWILASKIKRQEPVDEEELGWIIKSLQERADRTERRGARVWHVQCPMSHRMDLPMTVWGAFNTILNFTLVIESRSRMKSWNTCADFTK
ncbi:hypothetical protein [uncultured Brevibacillus sp.]|uniref:hypothetical protein n=1 Tax=uncultured Brevibacillus sp. TaxID=169970 RepID=UPI0025914B06|nr:hypothetical protein [uncultured Brevibacillus sp.]